MSKLEFLCFQAVTEVRTKRYKVAWLQSYILCNGTRDDGNDQAGGKNEVRFTQICSVLLRFWLRGGSESCKVATDKMQMSHVFRKGRTEKGERRKLYPLGRKWKGRFMVCGGGRIASRLWREW